MKPCSPKPYSACFGCFCVPDECPVINKLTNALGYFDFCGSCLLCRASTQIASLIVAAQKSHRKIAVTTVAASGLATILSVAAPAEPRGEQKTFFLCKFWVVKNFYNWLKSAGEIFLSGLRGAKHFSNAFRIVFRIIFRVFQTVFRIDLKVFRGQFRSAGMPP